MRYMFYVYIFAIITTYNITSNWNVMVSSFIIPFWSGAMAGVFIPAYVKI